jgi:hypothetical protein
MGRAIISGSEYCWRCFGLDHFCNSPDICPGAASSRAESSSLSREEAEDSNKEHTNTVEKKNVVVTRNNSTGYQNDSRVKSVETLGYWMELLSHFLIHPTRNAKLLDGAFVTFLDPSLANAWTNIGLDSDHAGT